MIEGWRNLSIKDTIVSMTPESYFRYTEPEQSEKDEELRHHKFEVLDGENVVSAAEVNYYSRPLPFYQVTDLYTENGRQGEGYASAVLDQVEKFLIERGKPGILVDNSIYNREDGQSFYETRGWLKIDDEGHRVFNLPESVDTKIFASYYMRGVDMSED